MTGRLRALAARAGFGPRARTVECVVGVEPFLRRVAALARGSAWVAVVDPPGNLYGESLQARLGRTFATVRRDSMAHLGDPAWTTERTARGIAEEDWIDGTVAWAASRRRGAALVAVARVRDASVARLALRLAEVGVAVVACAGPGDIEATAVGLDPLSPTG